MSSQLEWTILDIEEEEWSKVTVAPSAVAALNETTQFAIGDSPPTADGRRSTRSWWQIAGSVLLVVVAVLLLGFRLLRTAEQGLTHMRGDIEVAVKNETLHQRMSLPASDKYATVEAVEFISGDAMAHIVVTQTLAGGHVVGMHETQFFVMSPQGWTLSKPIAAFWGRRETLDTLHLHFVFGAKDRTIIAEVAPEAEEFYVALWRIVAPQQHLTQLGSGDLLTVEIVPERLIGGGTLTPGSLRLTSPLLYRPGLLQTRTEILATVLRQLMVQRVLDVDAPLPPPKPQWAFMAAGLRNWLQTSDYLPLPLHPEYDRRNPVTGIRSMQLADLSQPSACAPQTYSSVAAMPTIAVDQINADERSCSRSLSSWQEANILLDFVAKDYGLDAVGSLVQGFARYGDWESLVPATLGSSAGELENSWLGQAAAPDE